MCNPDEEELQHEKEEEKRKSARHMKKDSQAEELKVPETQRDLIKNHSTPTPQN